MAEQKPDHRSQLIDFAQKISASFDKTVLALSGGALGISLVFVKDFIGAKSIAYAWFLYVAWTAWTLSISTLLVALYLATLAYTDAISDFDAGKTSDLGGAHAGYLPKLNFWSMLLFFVGVIFMLIFVGANM